MVLRSQNGYTANDRSLIASFTVPGTSRKVSLRKGDTSVILLDFAAWFHKHIEPIDDGIFDDWGYAERTVRGSSTTLSNHASGTCFDLNATKHPMGKRNTFTPDQQRKIRERLEYYEGCIRAGMDYITRPDDMHFEINRGAADCKRVADKIRRGTPATPVAPTAPVARPHIPHNEEDDDMHIPLTLDDNGSFRAAVKVEAGAGTATGYRVAYLSLGTTDGDTDFIVTALGINGSLRQYNNGTNGEFFRLLQNGHWVQTLPEGTRTVRIEGRTIGRAVPTAAVWHVR